MENTHNAVPVGGSKRPDFEIYQVGKELFEVPKKYQVLCKRKLLRVSFLVGKGSYGCVVKALDKERDELVAIKKFVRAFDHKVFTLRALRELTILRQLQHPFVTIPVNNMSRSARS